MTRPSHIPRFQNHDAVLSAWRSMGLSNAAIIHVDAHADLGDTASGINVGNYLTAAIKEGIAKEVWWITPDTYFLHGVLLKTQVVEVFRSLYRCCGWVKPEVNPTQVISAFGEAKVVACTVASLPRHRVARPAILDIDCDYFLASFQIDKRSEIVSTWCWPCQLHRILDQKEIHPNATFVTSSVPGGYTPLQWQRILDICCSTFEDPGCVHQYQREWEVSTQLRMGDIGRAFSILKDLAFCDIDAALQYSVA